MRPLPELLAYFPSELQDKQLDILREYMQYEMLKVLFGTRHGHKFTFLGGTALRIVYGTERFSEDLDFDNVGLTREEFEHTLKQLQRGMALLDYPCELSFTYKGAFHCAVRYPSLVFRYGLSGHKEARLMVKVDTEKQDYPYTRNVTQVTGFGVAADVAAVPPALLCSMKVAAVLGRRRAKGRDFYDLSWLLERTTPDYGYLAERFGITNAGGLRACMSAHTGGFDFGRLAQDVAPSLLRRADIGRVEGFREMWAAATL